MNLEPGNPNPAKEETPYLCLNRFSAERLAVEWCTKIPNQSKTPGHCCYQDWLWLVGRACCVLSLLQVHSEPKLGSERKRMERNQDPATIAVQASSLVQIPVGIGYSGRLFARRPTPRIEWNYLCQYSR